MRFKIYCLSLLRSVDRRARIAAEAARVGVTFEFCDGPDARELPSGQLEALADQAGAVQHFGRPLGLTEIACAEGHRRIYRTLLASGDDAAVVLEDDITLDDRFPSVMDGLKAMDREWAQCPALCMLGGAWIRRMPLLLSRRHPLPVTGVHRLFRVLRSHAAMYGAYSYLISRSGAAAILQAQPLITVPADAWDYHWNQRVLQEVWLLEPQAAFHRPDFDGSLLVEERTRMEQEKINHDRRLPLRMRRLAATMVSPGRLARSLGSRLGWLHLKRECYAVWSHFC